MESVNFPAAQQELRPPGNYPSSNKQYPEAFPNITSGCVSNDTKKRKATSYRRSGFPFELQLFQTPAILLLSSWCKRELFNGSSRNDPNLDFGGDSFFELDGDGVHPQALDRPFGFHLSRFNLVIGFLQCLTDIGRTN